MPHARTSWWLAPLVVVPLGVMALAVAYLITSAARSILHPTWVPITLAGILVLATSSFFMAMLRESHIRETSLLRRNEELFSLYQAGLEVHGQLVLDQVLQRIVDRACDLIGARYGALSVIDSQDAILEFVTSGISSHVRREIGEPPKGRGLLGVALHEGERLRTPDVGSDPRSVGFPESHPAMRSLLAVPLQCETLRGNLYLAEKETADEFSADDEETLVRFAKLASVAVDTAERHDRLTVAAVAHERVRIASELHDGLAQDLAAIRVRAQTAHDVFGRGDVHLAAGLLADVEASARLLQGDIREEIGGLRTSPTSARSLQDLATAQAVAWSEQHGIPVEMRVTGQTLAAAEVRLQFQRILQEALNNVARHAEASNVRLVVDPRDDGVRVEIWDDGRGLPEAHAVASPRGSFGLRIMRERAQAIGAELEVASGSGGGTSVRLEMPTKAVVG